MESLFRALDFDGAGAWIAFWTNIKSVFTFNTYCSSCCNQEFTIRVVSLLDVAYASYVTPGAF